MGLRGVDIIENVTFTFRISEVVLLHIGWPQILQTTDLSHSDSLKYNI